MDVRFRQIARAYLAAIGVWCGLALLTGWQYRALDQQLNIKSSLLDTILLAESRGFAYALLTPPIFYLVRRYMASTRTLLSHLWVYCVILPPFMVMYACIRWLVLPPRDEGLQQYLRLSAHGPIQVIYRGFADQITMFIAIVVAGHAYEYFRRVRNQELEKYEYQQALAASELQALKMQLHPHFLFNTLHSISTLIESDRKTARAMIVRLSGLLRTSLEQGKSDLIPLTEELKFVGEYLELEMMRFGARLTVTWTIDPDTLPVLVPHMILQPLVENAIRHGIGNAREGGAIEIDAHRENGNIALRVRNGVSGARPQGTGVGLRNTRARLKYLYAEEAVFSFAIAEDHTATARLVLPALCADRQKAPSAPEEPEDEGEKSCVY